jgi:hypothetical protein
MKAVEERRESRRGGLEDLEGLVWKKAVRDVRTDRGLGEAAPSE